MVSRCPGRDQALSRKGMALVICRDGRI